MKKKIAVLFPGIGYTCDKPLLYYTGKLAVARGYKLVKVEYGNFPSGIKENKEKMEEAFRCGLEQAEKILQDICWEEYFIYTTSADIFICRWEWDCISWNGRPVG